jgi:hypothetical protein
MYSLHIDLDA